MLMPSSFAIRSSVLVALVSFNLLPYGRVHGAEPVAAEPVVVEEAKDALPTPTCLEDLAKLSWAELEQLYRAAEPGNVPTGYYRGLGLFCRSAPFGKLRYDIAKTVWKGKHFSDCGDRLVNQFAGFRGIQAKVYPGVSWLDGRPCTVMDYQQTSFVWRTMYDEVREISPGLYLGISYQRRCPCPKFDTFFALQVSCKAKGKIHFRSNTCSAKCCTSE